MKVKDAQTYLTQSETAALDRLLDKIAKGRMSDGKAPFDCMVVEHDWPEYEPTWAAIAVRVDNEQVSRSR